jgi:hypothetical protein
LCLICCIYRQTANLTSWFLQRWYSQQAAEGNAPGHPLGFDRSQRFGPIKMVGGEIGGNENNDAGIHP